MKEQENEASGVSPQVIALAGLAAEFCSLLERCSSMQPREFCAGVVRYLPRIFATINDIRPYGGEEGEETGMIYDTLDEGGYDAVLTPMASAFGEYDMYLDTPVEDMRYSDTPVAVSLAEKLADIYQDMYNFADTVRQAPSDAMPLVLSELKYRFDGFLSESICDALRASNFIYRKQVLE